MRPAKKIIEKDYTGKVINVYTNVYEAAKKTGLSTPTLRKKLAFNWNDVRYPEFTNSDKLIIYDGYYNILDIFNYPCQCRLKYGNNIQFNKCYHRIKSLNYYKSRFEYFNDIDECNNIEYLEEILYND